MTTKKVVERSLTVNNNRTIQDYVHPDDQTQPTFDMTPGFKPFTVLNHSLEKFDFWELLLFVLGISSSFFFRA